MRFTPPKFICRLFPNFIWTLPGNRGEIYLTFDDGPSPEVTPWVLDELDRHQAKATFFCLGKNVEMHPRLFDEIRTRGHAVGNHSYSHIKGWGMDTGLYLRDVDLAGSYIGNNLFRPPYGRIGPHQARMVSERYHIIMWSILSRDYNRSLTGKSCARGVVKHLRPGDIVVFHDSRKSAKNLWHALPATLKFIHSKGWECRPIAL